MRSARYPILPLFVLLLIAPYLTPAWPETPSQETTDAGAAETPFESNMDALKRLTLPGEHHEHLNAIVGKWKTELRIWLSPDGDPIVTTGEAETRWILGRRFVETTYRAQFMGQPFEGKGVEGYDNYAKQYVGTWRDTMGTYTRLFTGQCEEDCRVRTMVAEFTDPVSGQQLTNRTVTSLIDDDGYRFESLLVAPDGQTFKTLEMTARRQN